MPSDRAGPKHRLSPSGLPGAAEKLWLPLALMPRARGHDCERPRIPLLPWGQDEPVSTPRRTPAALCHNQPRRQVLGQAAGPDHHGAGLLPPFRAHQGPQPGGGAAPASPLPFSSPAAGAPEP